MRARALLVLAVLIGACAAKQRHAAAWMIDDHVGLHAVAREKALAALSTYDEQTVLRIGRKAKGGDFEIVGTDRVAKWTTTTQKTRFDPEAFASDALFVGAVSDVNGEVWVHLVVLVEDEREAHDVIRASRRGR
jgi:hypothetical protein